MHRWKQSNQTKNIWDCRTYCHDTWPNPRI